MFGWFIKNSNFSSFVQLPMVKWIRYCSSALKRETTRKLLALFNTCQHLYKHLLNPLLALDHFSGKASCSKSSRGTTTGGGGHLVCSNVLWGVHCAPGKQRCAPGWLCWSFATFFLSCSSPSYNSFQQFTSFLSSSICRKLHPPQNEH